MRVSEGSWKSKDDGSGTAYYHRFNGAARPIQQKDMVQYNDISGSSRQCEGLNLLAIGERLGLSIRSLQRLHAGWDVKISAEVWPMNDWDGRVVGLRMVKNGNRWTRGHNGLFMPDGLNYEVPLLLPEGYSDTGACLDLGFESIGRFSCSGGTDMILQLLKKIKHRIDVVIVSDRDKVHYTKDGKQYWPGQQGSRKLLEALVPYCKSACMIIPPRHKDIRAWFLDGATRREIESLILNTRHYYS